MIATDRGPIAVRADRLRLTRTSAPSKLSATVRSVEYQGTHLQITLAAPENIEAIGDAGIAYADETDLAEKLQRVLRDGSLVHAYRNRAQARVKEFYDWDYVVDRYEDLFAKMAGLSLPTRTAPVASKAASAMKETARSASA